MTARVDLTGLERRLRSLRDGADSAALEVAKSGADHFVGFMVDHAPRDTGRYIAGWVRAGNAAGLPRRPVPNLTESRWQKKFVEALDRQIDRYIHQINKLSGILDSWYFSQGRPLNAWGRKKRAEINRLTRKLERAVEQKRRFLNAEGPVLVIDLFSNGRRVLNAKGKLRSLRLTTVRDTLYGGTGFVGNRDGELKVILHNREPHVSIVERRYRLISRANGAVRRYTDARGKRIYLQELGKIAKLGA